MQKETQSRLGVVLHLCHQDKANTFVFEEISHKLNFHPCRLATLEELLQYLASTTRPPEIISLEDSIVDIYPNEVTLEAVVAAIGLIIQTRFPENSTKITVLAQEVVSREKVKSWKVAGIDGVIPIAAEFSFQISMKAYQDLLEHGQSWPPEVIEKSAPRTRQSRKVSDSNGIDLTDRQAQVRDLLCERGLSNKAIARQLSISESTVKIHVGSILKRYGVRNRTQLALAVNNGARL